MANICEFEMRVKGTKENIMKFYDVMSQKGSTWMGRGADAYLSFDEDTLDTPDGVVGIINGACKWALKAALVDDALSMRKQKTTGKGWWGDIDNVEEFVTVFEACDDFHLDMEAYSREEGNMFEEHIGYINGEIIDEEMEIEDADADGYEWAFEF